MVIKAGDQVRFTGHGYRRAIEYNYAKLFGNSIHRVNEVRTSCCNRFLVLDDVIGMYSEKFFKKDTPLPLLPNSTEGNEQREGCTTEPR